MGQHLRVHLQLRRVFVHGEDLIGQLHHAGMIADRVRQVVDLAPNV